MDTDFFPSPGIQCVELYPQVFLVRLPAFELSFEEPAGTLDPLTLDPKRRYWGHFWPYC